MRFRPARGSRPFFSYLPSFLSRWAASFCDVRFVLSLPCGKAEASSKCERRYTSRSEEHTSELQSRLHLVCRLLLEKKKKKRASVALIILLELLSSTAHYGVC